MLESPLRFYNFKNALVSASWSGFTVNNLNVDKALDVKI